MFLLILIVGSALSISFFCSILEATLLSSRVVQLSQRKEQGDKGAALLLQLKETQLEDAIGAILTYNTIAHTVGAALSGAQAAVVFGSNWLGLFSGVLTLLILIFTEIIPKTLGTVYSEKLAGVVGLTLFIMIKPPMKWILFFTRALTRLVAPSKPQTTTRGDVQAMVKLAARDGAIASDESKVLSNFLNFEEIPVSDVMTPRTVVTMFDESQTLSEVVAIQASRAYSRIPLYRETRDDVRGYVLMRELLRSLTEGKERDALVSTFARPLTIIPEILSVGNALKQFTQQKIHMALTADELGVISGLVTMEDLIETALGVEIVDELDQATDLRKVAIELRDKRLSQMEALRLELQDSDTP